MEIIQSNQILKDLHVVLSLAKERLTNEFVLQEVELNSLFKVDYQNFLAEKKCGVDYLKSTTVVTNSSGQKIYIANQWFVIASYFVDFCTELLTYRNLFAKICKDYMFMNATEMKAYATKLKACPTDEDKTRFTFKAIEMLRDDFPSKKELHEQTAGYLWNFVSNYKWWAGSKTVDRHDFFISALLNQMNVVNNNSEYLAIITHSFASTLGLRILVENPENFTINLRLNTYAPIEEYDAEYLTSFVSESPAIRSPRKSKGISISAASLERFQSNS